jgi:hypothetical protein
VSVAPTTLTGNVHSVARQKLASRRSAACAKGRGARARPRAYRRQDTSKRFVAHDVCVAELARSPLPLDLVCGFAEPRLRETPPAQVLLAEVLEGADRKVEHVDRVPAGKRVEVAVERLVVPVSTSMSGIATVPGAAVSDQ